KGRVIWGGKEVPVPAMIAAVGVPETGLLSNAKNKGIKNVFVYFLEEPGKPIPIHPSLKQVPQQPAIIGITKITFVPRCVAIREGQVLVIKNGTMVPENIRLFGDPSINDQDRAVLVPAMAKVPIADLKAQRLPLPMQSK